MENIFGLTTCVAIVVIAYLVGIVIKNTDAIDDKWIPAICGIVGAPLGVLALHIVPDFPATDYLTAVAVGIVSGLAATGVNQVFLSSYGKAAGSLQNLHHGITGRVVGADLLSFGKGKERDAYIWILRQRPADNLPGLCGHLLSEGPHLGVREIFDIGHG